MVFPIILDASPCRTKQEDSVIWPSTPGGSTVVLNRCKTIFSVGSAVGNLSRTCEKDSDGLRSSWNSVDRCQCQSIHINSVQDRVCAIQYLVYIHLDCNQFNSDSILTICMIGAT